MSHRQKFTIVTISYNQGMFLDTCIRSVLDQEYEPIEYIIVDAGSTDGSRDIIEGYGDRIHQIIFEPDNGPADGLNKGFNHATGELFGYLNADDFLLPEAVARAARAFARYPGADVLLAHGYKVNAEGQVISKIFSTHWSLRAYALGVANAVQQATFIRKTAFKRAGGFNRDNYTCWDGELLVDLALSGATIAPINEFWGGFRIGTHSISGSGRLIDQYRRDHCRLATKALGYAPNVWSIPLKWLLQLDKYLRNPGQTWSKLLLRFRIL